MWMISASYGSWTTLSTTLPSSVMSLKWNRLEFKQKWHKRLWAYWWCVCILHSQSLRKCKNRGLSDLTCSHGILVPLFLPCHEYIYLNCTNVGSGSSSLCTCNISQSVVCHFYTSWQEKTLKIWLVCALPHCILPHENTSTSWQAASVIQQLHLSD